MWWRLGLLGGVTALVLALLLMPVGPVSVTIDLPPGTAAGPPSETAEQFASMLQWITWIVTGAVVLSVLIVAGVLARLIVKRHRKPG